VTTVLPAQNMMAKAERACTSARALLELCDADVASNRAYFAMFDAARSALLSVGGGTGKTHRGLINAFSDRLIKTGIVSKDLGRLLKRAEEARLAADYKPDTVELGDAQQLVENAELFVRAMRAQFLP
jgi:uncharacterized protein (UPF0332 family)